MDESLPSSPCERQPRWTVASTLYAGVCWQRWRWTGTHEMTNATAHLCPTTTCDHLLAPSSPRAARLHRRRRCVWLCQAHALCVQGCIDLGDGQALARLPPHAGAIGSSPEAIERIVFFTLANTAGTVARSVAVASSKEQFGISALSEIFESWRPNSKSPSFVAPAAHDLVALVVQDALIAHEGAARAHCVKAPVGSTLFWRGPSGSKKLSF